MLEIVKAVGIRVNQGNLYLPSPLLQNGSALLPCSLEGGRVYTVLWYRAGEGEPFYT